MSRENILIVDDDPSIRDMLRVALEEADYSVVEAGHGRMALESLHQRSDIDLVLLDVGMPHMGGFECCREIRKFSQVPVLFLTAQDNEVDRVVGFEVGADDYVAKPFSPRELLLRIRAILQRVRRDSIASQQHGDLLLDEARHACSLGGRDFEVTPTQFAVLATFLSRPGLVLSRNDLIDGAYGGNAALSGRTVDSHIRNIRAKAAERGYYNVIESVRGVGLRLGTCTPSQKDT